MAWEKPKYSKIDVNSAGKLLAAPALLTKLGRFDEAAFQKCLKVVDNFRASHAFALNTLQVNLREHAKTIDAQSITAQRLKRLTSIIVKLIRFKTMHLWDMQDIGGCRAILTTVDQVDQLAEVYTTKATRIRHELVGRKNYVLHPKPDGYRSRHLIFRYISDRNQIYNGMKIEMQIRTMLQHVWATAVETVDAFTNQALKSSKGSDDWKRFFQLMGTEFAFREGTPLVPGTPRNRVLWINELKDCANKLHVKATLLSFTSTLQAVLPAKNFRYFLLSLEQNAEKLSVTGYTKMQLEIAAKAYAQREKQIEREKTGDAVLVSVESIRELQSAYPNYFADTKEFVRILDECMSL